MEVDGAFEPTKKKDRKEKRKDKKRGDEKEKARFKPY
jgi:hypothetical protein